MTEHQLGHCYMAAKLGWEDVAHLHWERSGLHRRSVMSTECPPVRAVDRVNRLAEAAHWSCAL